MIEVVRQGTVLYGMMGSGKTTLGEGLARFLDQPFIDTDELIETRTEMSCKEIIDHPALDFGAVQKRIILGYRPEEPTVIATGGSVASYPELTEHLGRFGIGIFLNVDSAALEARLPAERKAALNNPKGLSFAELYTARAELYQQAADLTLQIEPAETPDQSMTRLIHLRQSPPKK